MLNTTSNINSLMHRLESMQEKFRSSSMNGQTNLSDGLASEFSSLFDELASAIKAVSNVESAANDSHLHDEGLSTLNSSNLQNQPGNGETVSGPISQAMQNPTPKDLDFKIKYIDGGSHPISGRKMFSAHLILDNDVVYRADNLYSRQAVKEELNTVMAEIKAEQSNTDQFVNVNYGTELLKVSPEGERLLHSRVDQTVSAPVSQAMQSTTPEDLDFKIKYIDGGSHPISGRKMFSAHLILDNDVVYRADNLYSRQAVKEELNTVMAEIKAEQRNADQFVKLNYGTELLKVTSTGERIKQSMTIAK